MDKSEADLDKILSQARHAAREQDNAAPSSALAAQILATIASDTAPDLEPRAELKQPNAHWLDRGLGWLAGQLWRPLAASALPLLFGLASGMSSALDNGDTISTEYADSAILQGSYQWETFLAEEDSQPTSSANPETNPVGGSNLQGLPE